MLLWTRKWKESSENKKMETHRDTISLEKLSLETIMACCWPEWHLQTLQHTSVPSAPTLGAKTKSSEFVLRFMVSFMLFIFNEVWDRAESKTSSRRDDELRFWMSLKDTVKIVTLNVYSNIKATVECFVAHEEWRI